MSDPTPCIYLFGVLRRFQHCTGHITTGSWKGKGNQYIQFVKVLYCKLPTNGKQLTAFPLEAVLGTKPRPQKWEARVLPLCHRDPPHPVNIKNIFKWFKHLQNIFKPYLNPVFWVTKGFQVNIYIVMFNNA